MKRLRNKTRTNPQIKNHKKAMNSEWSDYRHDIIQNTCTYILKSTTTICGENCESLWVHHHSCRKMHWLTPWSRVLPRACHLSLSKARSIQSIPSQPIYWRSILILSFHLYLGLMSGLFQVSPPKPNRCHSFSPYVPHDPTHLIPLNFIT